MKKLVSLIIMIGFSISANAALIVYNNAVNWQNAVGAFNTETFGSSPLSMSTTDFSQGFNGFTINATTFGELVGVTNDASTSCQNGGLCAPFANQNFFGWRNSNGGHGPDLAFTGLTTAIGFDFFNSDPTDNYQIFVNGGLVGAFQTSNAGFFGIVATAGMTINTFSIMHNATGGFVGLAGIDNVRTAARTQIPEPASIVIFALALMGLFGLKRRTV